VQSSAQLRTRRHVRRNRQLYVPQVATLLAASGRTAHISPLYSPAGATARGHNASSPVSCGFRATRRQAGVLGSTVVFNQPEPPPPTRKLSFSCGDPAPRLTRGSLGPPPSPHGKRTAYGAVYVFASANDCISSRQTDRRTEGRTTPRQYSVTLGRTGSSDALTARRLFENINFYSRCANVTAS